MIKIKSWDDMTFHEKIETLRRNMDQMYAAQNALTSDLGGTWEALRATRSELDKISKVVGTLRSLWPKSYSRTG